MYGISDELKAKYTDDESHHIQYYIEFFYVMDMDNNTPILTVNNDKLVSESVEYKDGISGGDNIEIGSVYTSEITFDAADISTALVGRYMRVYQIVDDLDEKLPIGRFIVTSVTKTSDKRIKSVTGYDYTALFDENGAKVLEKMSACKTVGDALTVLSDHFGLEWSDATFEGWDYELSWDYEQSKDDEFIVKDLVAMLGEILGGWIKVDRNGKLFLKTIKKPDEMETITYARSNPDYEENEIGVIENVSFTDTDNTTYNASSITDGNSVDLSGNFFLIGGEKEKIKKFLALSLKNINTIQYYPAEVTLDARPYMDAGDFVKFYDGDTELYTLIKERTLKGVQRQIETYSCTTYNQTAEVSYFSASARAQATMNAVKRVNYNVIQAQQELANALENSSGMYDTKVEQEDGAYILYFHNKKELSESDLVIMITIEAIGFSTDGGKTYPFGIRINGDVIANILSAYGVNADWINVGSISIGGASSNADGSINIYDVDDNLICKVDSDGLWAILGSIGGWLIGQDSITSEDGTVQLNSKENALKFYSATKTLLMRINNNGVYNYDSNGTLRNALSSTSNVFYDSSGKKRIDINSDGIKQYDTDGTYLGHLGRGTVYAVDSSGDITDTEIGEIMSVELEETDTSLGWSIFARVPDSEITAKQRRVYYCNQSNSEYVQDTFYVNCDTVMLRHQETDPYYTKNIAFDSTNKTFTVTAGCGAWEDTEHDITNTFEWTEDESGNVTSIYNRNTGRMLKVQNG